MFDKIKKINSLFSVAGYENKLTDFIMSEGEKYCDECFRDNIGNIICHKKGEGEKILINVPVSYGGLFITGITENGYGKFHTIGNIKPEAFVGVKVKDETGKIEGVILPETLKDELTSDDMCIDFGFLNKAAAEKEIKTGMIFEPYSELFELKENLYGSKLSESVGIYIALEFMKIKPEGDIYFAFTVMDNLGFKGAKTAATLIDPDICYTLSVADIGNKSTKIKQGEGVAVRIKDSYIIVNKQLRDTLIKKLSDEKIPYQPEIVSDGGLSNNEIMYLSNGILTANLNCPIKGKGSKTECVNKNDIENTLKSIKVIIA